jgi:hypothetical protein
MLFTLSWTSPFAFGKVTFKQKRWNSWTALTQVTSNSLQLRASARRRTLIGALLQATHAPHAFVTQCKTYQLRELLVRISQEKILDYVCWALPTLSWRTVADIVCNGSSSDAGQVSRNAELFGAFWSRLAAEHMDETQVDEHNSLKHGFRVGHGGIQVAIGPAGMHSPADSDFTDLGGSRDGTSFYRIERTSDGDDMDRGRQSRRVFVNWTRESMAIALQLIACSITNVVSMLKLRNGASGTSVQFKRLTSDAAFTRPWETTPSLRTLQFGPEVYKPRPRTKAEIIDEWHRLKKEAIASTQSANRK